MRKNKLTKICEHCNKQFETLDSRVRFCNRKCADNNRKKLKNCEWCSVEFHSKNNRKKFCSEDCFKKYKNKDKVSRECTICNKVYFVSNCRSDKSKYCSEECRVLGFSKLDRTVNKVYNCKCDNCDDKMYRTPSKLRSMNFCSYDCMGEYYSKNNIFSGENSGTWNGGKKTYYGENWLSQRRKVRKRDNYTCQKCGITEEDYGQELSVHHIKPFILFDNYLEANKEENLICLCEPCHRKIHSGNNHPSKFSKTYKKE